MSPLTSVCPGPSQLGAMYSSLVEGLCHEFDSSSHLVVDASAHWVIKRLLANQAKGKGQSCHVRQQAGISVLPLRIL